MDILPSSREHIREITTLSISIRFGCPQGIWPFGSFDRRDWDLNSPSRDVLGRDENSRLGVARPKCKWPRTAGEHLDAFYDQFRGGMNPSLKRSNQQY